MQPAFSLLVCYLPFSKILILICISSNFPCGVLLKSRWFRSAVFPLNKNNNKKLRKERLRSLFWHEMPLINPSWVLRHILFSYMSIFSSVICCKHLHKIHQRVMAQLTFSSSYLKNGYYIYYSRDMFITCGLIGTHLFLSVTVLRFREILKEIPACYEMGNFTESQSNKYHSVSENRVLWTLLGFLTVFTSSWPLMNPDTLLLFLSLLVQVQCLLLTFFCPRLTQFGLQHSFQVAFSAQKFHMFSNSWIK